MIETEKVTRVNGEEREVAKVGEHLIGHVDVDAGLIMIGDPCYSSDKTDCAISNWSEFCNWLDSDDIYPTAKAIPHGRGHEGYGVVVSSGFGDGTYPVYATVVDEGLWGRRISEVKVVFIGEEEEEL